MSTALLAPLEQLSGNKVEVWARPAHLELFRAQPAVSRVLAYDPARRHRGPLGLLRWWQRCRGEAGRPDALWLIPDSFSSALYARLSAVPCRLGRKGQGRDWLLSHPLAIRADRRRHWIEERAALVAASCCSEEMNVSTLMPSVEIPERHLRSVEQYLAQRDLRAADCCVFVAGATYGPTKCWPGFADLAESLPDSLTILLVGTEADRQVIDPLGQALAQRGRSWYELVGEFCLLELAALLRDVAFTVSGDTGPMHLAAACGGRVLGLFASTSPVWTAPRGPQARWIESGTECAPCFRRDCPLPAMVCMEALDTQRVIAALGDWLPGEGSR